MSHLQANLLECLSFLERAVPTIVSHFFQSIQLINIQRHLVDQLQLVVPITMQLYLVFLSLSDKWCVLAIHFGNRLQSQDRCQVGDQSVGYVQALQTLV